MSAKHIQLGLLALLLLFLLSSCTPAWGPAVREIHPGAEEKKEIYWDSEKHLWTAGKRPASAPDSNDDDSKSATRKPQAAPGNAAVQEIETGEVSRAAEEKLIQLQQRALSRREYIREKFKGKEVVFPEELPEEPPGRPTYRIGPEDELHVFVWQNPDLSLDVVVRSDGKISLPLIGEVEVAGLQIPELQNLLEQKYATYIETPNVTVTVKAANSLKVFITGAVRISTFTAGPLPTGFPLRGDKRLLTALSQVEIMEDADLREAYIIRGETIVPLDLHRLLKDGDMTQNVLLKPADTVVIPSRLKEVAVLGEVDRPARYKVERQTTLLDALAVAGGVNRETAVLDLAYLARGGRIVPVNFKRLIDAGDLDQNILLEDRDVIYIPSSQQNKIYVMGEVNRPQVVRYTDTMDILEAISEAGGFPTTANRQQVVVVRGGLHDPRVYAVNVLKMMKGQARERFILDRFDIVYVPRTLIADWNVFINQLLPSANFANAIKDLGD